MKHIITLLYLVFATITIFAQPWGQTARDDENQRLYDEYREQLFQEYSYDSYLKDQQEAILDSLEVEEKVLISPNELKKLGVPKEVIEELFRLQFEQDSVSQIQDDFEQYVRDQEGISDSISLDDIQALIELQKKLVVKKALSLPPSEIYGHEFFRKNMLKLFDDETKMRPPENYVLSVGDELSVVIWGYADYSETFIIDQNGSIEPELVGRIYLKGLTFENAKSLIREKFSKAYDLQNSKIDVTLNYTQVVSVNMVGELFNPGTYTFPSLNSVFNALVAIDGPNQLGSIRKIHVRRNGNTIKTLDLYQLLTNPDSKIDFFLEDNDYVVVPSLNKVVAITGEVKRDHSYELIGNEGINELLTYSGGLKPTAFTKGITVKRIRNSQEVLLNVNLDSLRKYNRNFGLEDGDSIFVYKVPQVLRNYVQVSGAVKVPGKYELRTGERVSDLLMRAEGVIDEAYLDRGFVHRLNKDLRKQVKTFNVKEVITNRGSPENILLTDLDTIQIMSKETFRQNFYVNVSGAIQVPGEYEFAEGLTLKDLLFYSGGLRKEAANNRIEISRVLNFQTSDNIALASTGDDNISRVIIQQIEIGYDLSLEDGSENFEIKPYDHVFVRTSPDFELQQNVKLYGEIVYPGEYSLINKEERITNLIARAGGVTEYAFKEGATLYREQDSVGFVILDLQKVDKEQNPKFNYILTDGDSIYIPKVRDFVTITGAVNYPKIDSIGQINVPWERGKTANYYINKYAAGYHRYAKKSSTLVTQPNGAVVNTNNYILFNDYPEIEKGSKIFVDLKERRKPENIKKKEKEDRNWNANFERLSTQLVTVFTLLILAQQAFNN